VKRGKETRTGQNMIYKFFFATILACVLFIAGQTPCFASTVVLQWDPNTDADLAGYKVYYQADSSTPPFTGKVTNEGANGGDSPINVGNITTATISGLDPTHPYYFAVTAYNTSGVESAYSNIVYVPVLISPSGPSGTVSINQGNYTNKTAVKLNLTASGITNVAAYCISNTNTCTKWTKLTTPVTPLTISAIPWTLAAGADGNRTVSVWYKDTSGNVSADPASATITLDTKAPLNGTFTPIQLPGNQIQLDWAGFSDATSGIASYRLVRGATLPAASCTGATIATPSATDTTYTDTGTQQGMKYYYRLCALDNVGNVSTGATTPAVMAIPEVTKPSGSVSINQGNYTSKATVELNLTVNTAGANVAAYCISNTNTCTKWTKLTPSGPTPLSISAKPWTLAAGADGNRTVSVQYMDVWGNVSDPASASITLDKTPPVNGKLAIDSTFTLNWNGFGDATSGIASYVLVRDTKTYPACSTASAVIYSGSQTSYPDRSGRHSTSGTTYYYRLCAVDKAGNISKGTTASMKKP
jgi:chitinase